jgi:DNA-binding SARP family transcriptional activator
MNEVVRVKLRKIGSSVGLLVPKEQLVELNADAGDEIDVAFLKHRTPAELKKLADEGFGIAKGFTKPFERDKRTREF